MDKRVRAAFPRLVALTAFLLLASSAWAEGPAKILSADLQYGLVYSSVGPAASQPHFLSVGVSWGYLIGESETGLTMLSLLLTGQMFAQTEKADDCGCRYMQTMHQDDTSFNLGGSTNGQNESQG